MASSSISQPPMPQAPTPPWATPGAVPVTQGGKLSNESAAALYERINKLDESIDFELGEMHNANIRIVVAHDRIKLAYEERERLAEELDRLAQDDFDPTVSMGDVAYPTGYRQPRFRRKHPLAIVHRPMASDQLEARRPRGKRGYVDEDYDND